MKILSPLFYHGKALEMHSFEELCMIVREQHQENVAERVRYEKNLASIAGGFWRELEIPAGDMVTLEKEPA